MKRSFRMAAQAGLLLLLCAVSQGAQAQFEPFLGQIAAFPYNFCPVGWTQMNGQLLPISQYAALFSLLGITYGGDGKTTFALPIEFPVTTPNGVTLIQCIAISGVFPSRN